MHRTLRLICALLLTLLTGTHCSLLSPLLGTDAEDDELSLLALAALIGAANSGATATDRLLLATSLPAFGSTGELHSFRKTEGDCTLTPLQLFAIGTSPYDLIVAPEADTVYVALAGEQAIMPFAIDLQNDQLSALSAVTQTGPGTTTPYGMDVHPNGSWLYSADGSAPGSTAVFNRDTNTGALRAQTPAFQTGGNNMWYATLDRSGSFLYVANFNGFGDAGNDTVYGYVVNQSTGALTPMGTPTYATENRPWYIATHPEQDWLYIANNGSGSISQFQIDSTTGALTAIGSGVVSATGSPIGLAIGRRFAFAADNSATGNVYGYTIDQSTGALTVNSTTTTGAAGVVPYGLALDDAESCLYVARTDESAATSTDEITVYSVSDTGALTLHSRMPAGSGPRFLSIVRQ